MVAAARTDSLAPAPIVFRVTARGEDHPRYTGIYNNNNPIKCSFWPWSPLARSVTQSDAWISFYFDVEFSPGDHSANSYTQWERPNDITILFTYWIYGKCELCKIFFSVESHGNHWVNTTLAPLYMTKATDAYVAWIYPLIVFVSETRGTQYRLVNMVDMIAQRPALVECWASVSDTGPTFNQSWTDRLMLTQLHLPVLRTAEISWQWKKPRG